MRAIAWSPFFEIGGRQMRRNVRWTQEEHFYLEELVGEYPFKEVIALYQAKAKKKKWPYRTATAIASRVYREIGDRRATQKNFTITALSALLNYPRDIVRGWNRNGWLKTEKAGHLTKITQESLDKLAATHPEVLANAGWDALVFLFGEEKAEEIQQLHYPHRKRPIRCLRTGTVYPSVVEAAKRNYLHPTTLRKWAKRGKHYAYLEVS